MSLTRLAQDFLHQVPNGTHECDELIVSIRQAFPQNANEVLASLSGHLTLLLERISKSYIQDITGGDS